MSATLDQGHPGDSVRIISFSKNESVLLKLSSLGVQPGDHLEIMAKAPFGGPISLKHGEATFFALRRNEPGISKLSDSNMDEKATILLVGFPNSGKSTLFNMLTGGSRKIANYSGITVDSGIGELESNRSDNQSIELVDLPGIYNLNPNSKDEGVTVSMLLNLNRRKIYQHICVVLDYQRLEASLSLALSIVDLVGKKVSLIINKEDAGEISDERRRDLEQKTGLKTLVISALRTEASVVDEFLRAQNLKEDVKTVGKLKLTRTATTFLSGSATSEVIEVVSNETEVAAAITHTNSRARQLIFDWRKHKKERGTLTEKIDRIVLNPYLGGVIFLSIFYIIFNAIYSWAGPVMDLVDGGIGSFGNWVGALLPEGLINSLIVDGIIAGVGGVLVFLPQIVFLFFLLSLLEQSGYIARAAVVTDRLMGLFGLNGKAFLPYMSGFACSIPGIMAARTIPNQKERMVTMMTLPLVTCSARLPVYILLIGTFVPATTVLGYFNAQALSFFFLYFLGSFGALVIAKMFRLSFFKGGNSSFIIDLPLYQRPSIVVAFKQAALKGKTFLRKAGTIILGLSILIWVLSTFPRPDAALLENQTEAQQASIALQQSMLGTMGRAIEPVIGPLGMDWRMGVSMLVAFGARELFVSAMGTIFALGDVDEESDTLRQHLKNAINPKTGRPLFNLATAWAIMIFFVFSLQCTSTLAILRKETGSWRMPAIIFGYTLVLAYAGAFIAYNAIS